MTRQVSAGSNCVYFSLGYLVLVSTALQWLAFWRKSIGLQWCMCATNCSPCRSYLPVCRSLTSSHFIICLVRGPSSSATWWRYEYFVFYSFMCIFIISLGTYCKQEVLERTCDSYTETSTGPYPMPVESISVIHFSALYFHFCDDISPFIHIIKCTDIHSY